MASVVPTARPDVHHALPVHETLLVLDTDPERGLTGPEAGRRLEAFGSNTLPRVSTGGPLRRWFRQFHHPLVYVLLASATVTLGLGERVDTGVILAVVLLNAVVGFVQESKAEAALDALRSMVTTRARVRRDGRDVLVPSERLVPGDVVMLEAGDKVPADLRLVRVAELHVDESTLTGESVPAVKNALTLEESTPVADRHNMAYSGTLATSGTGTGVVVATGENTELGEIHRLVGSAPQLSTPLTRKLARFAKILTVVILALAAVTFVVGIARGLPTEQMFTAAVALAVGAIPEGLPAAVTITLAIGVGRMARRRAVIRRMPAVETLGSTTVVCTDKTGTLTRNQMTVRDVWTADRRYDVTGSGYERDGELRGPDGVRADPADDVALRWTLVTGAACNDATITAAGDRWETTGDPTEAAMLVAAAKGGIDPAWLAAEIPRRGALPFSSERRYMATWHARGQTGRSVVLAKGAVERILDLCVGQMRADGTTRTLDAERVLTASHELASRGLRVLATAMADVPEGARVDLENLDTGLVLTGLHAMLDPARDAAPAAVAACHAAGIAVKMITGDHAATAAAVAHGLGLPTKHAQAVVSGEQLASLSPAEFGEAVERASVFARVSPHQKLQLVAALQERGHVVAMTGDGVNDAPALRQADIGLAMGRNGTDVAKEAADMVLTDDDFATIESAVEEGRGVFDNLAKFIVWTLPTNMGEGFVILAAVFLGTALPILPVQILWINMTTAVALGLMLAFEPREPHIMSRPPRPVGRPLLTSGLVVRVLLVSALLVGGALWIFEWELAHGAELPEARTAAINLFVAVEVVYLFACRSFTGSAWRIGLLGNRWLLVGVAVQIVAQLALTYLPLMNALFDTAPIGLDTGLRLGAFAVVAGAVIAADKRLRRRIV